MKATIIVYQSLVKEQMNCFQKAKLDKTRTSFFPFFPRKRNERQKSIAESQFYSWTKRNEISMVPQREVQLDLVWRNCFEILWKLWYINRGKWILSRLFVTEAKMEYRFKSVFEEHRDSVHVNSNDRCNVRFKIYVSWLNAAFANSWNSMINLQFRVSTTKIPCKTRSITNSFRRELIQLAQFQPTNPWVCAATLSQFARFTKLSTENISIY